MCKSGPLTALLLLTVITVTRSQYFDILQGLQQLFQPYQQSNDFFSQYNGVTRNPGPNRQTNKKKNNNRHQNNDRNIKKQPVNQYDYVFATTEKPSRKTTKSNSSQSNTNSRNFSNKNQYSNILLDNYFTPAHEITTKANKVNRVKTTTEASYFNNNVYNDINRATTENIFSNLNNRPNNNFNVNRPVTENLFENKNLPQNYAVNNYETTGNIYNNQNNRRPTNSDSNGATSVGYYNNNFPKVPNNREFPQNTNSNQNNNNNNNNNRGILNTDYVNDFPSITPSNRDPNGYGYSNNQQNNNRGIGNNNRNTNDFGSTNTGFGNTNNNQRFPNNFGSNTGSGSNNQQSNNNRGIANNNRDINNFGSTTTGFGISDNNRGFPNNFGSNTGINNNNRGIPISGINPNEFDSNQNNNFGNTNYNNNNRPSNSFNSDTRPSNNFNTNTRPPNNFNINNRGNSNNNNNRGNPNNFENPSFIYPSNTPLINRPGVKPAPVEFGQPPITNKPVNGNNVLVFPRPTDPGYITFTEGPETAPEIFIGPDEDDMTERQKRRYVDLAERMCESYKALSIKTVVALPLVPSPDPVELNVSTCVPINVPLVIGGKVVSIRDFPHMALVGWMKNRNAGYSWKCGGSLISNQYVLTAGHCTYQDKDYDVVSGPPQAVQLGSSYLDDAGALVVKVLSVIRHPKYKERRSYHDIALIKMVSKVTFSEVIRPACLGVPPPEGDNIIATGWGRTEFGGDHSVELRSVSLPVWNIEECREIWGTSLKLPQGVTPDSHMCAGEKRGGKDTCQGDSGGPAQIQDGCTWRVVAVTSFGRSCGAPHTPALYAVIPHAFVAAQVFTEQS